MILRPEPDVLRAPRAEDPPSRAPLPLAAAAAPLVLAVVMWLVTGSALALLFGFLGPLLLVANRWDAARGRRRTEREARQRRSRALERLSRRVDAVATHVTVQADLRAPGVGPALVDATGRTWAPDLPDPPLLRLGLGHPGPLARLETPDDEGDADDLAPLQERLARGETVPVLAEVPTRLGLVGPEVLTASVVRAIIVQCAALSRPDRLELRYPADESWCRLLPHRAQAAEEWAWRSGEGEVIRVHRARSRAQLPAGCDLVVELDTTPERDRNGPEGGRSWVHDERGAVPVRPGAVTRAEARQWAQALADRARGLGLDAGAGDPPDSVLLADLVDVTDEPRSGDLPRRDGAGAPDPHVARAASLPARFLAERGGALELDLVRDGPHAIVGGTTGSGKSELLVSWLLALAARRAPEELTMLLIDFKGGAAFRPLAELPHVVDVLDDLGPAAVRRVVAGLRAELRRREGVLAEHGVAAIDALPAGELARLVIAVDEFAALLAEHPTVHEAFVDLAARGRSLGMHLVLGTQRPAAAARDALLANATLRLCLRVADANESRAVLGDDSAAQLPRDPRGRVIVDDGSRRALAQVALSTPADIATVSARFAEHNADVTWHPPLPVPLFAEFLHASEARHPAAASDTDAVSFGVLDQPEHARQPAARWNPREGHLLVLGAPSSGRTGALAAVLGGAQTARPDLPALVLPTAPADAAQALDELGDRGRPELVVVDDLDLLLARDPDATPVLVARLAALLRGTLARGAAVVASATRLPSIPASLAGQFGARLLLRALDRDDLLLAGAPRSALDESPTPGGGWWKGDVVQVVASHGDAGQLLAARRPRVEVPLLAPDGDQPLAVVSGRAGEFARTARDRGWAVVRLGADDSVVELESGLAAQHGPRPRVLLGDPDTWQTEWAALTAARTRGGMCFHAVGAAELRSLGRTRVDPPPLDGDEEAWCVRDGRVTRVRLAGPVDESRGPGAGR